MWMKARPVLAVAGEITRCLMSSVVKLFAAIVGFDDKKCRNASRLRPKCCSDAGAVAAAEFPPAPLLLTVTCGDDDVELEELEPMLSVVATLDAMASTEELALSSDADMLRDVSESYRYGIWPQSGPDDGPLRVGPIESFLEYIASYRECNI
jgi:hypothetical protein